MSSYNLMKVAGRNALRKDRQEELNALAAGIWPRDLDEAMRWTPPRGGKYSEKQWAQKMCKDELAALSDIERRLASNDPSLKGWER